MRERLKDNSGSAMLTALIVIFVVMILSLSVLAGAYNAYRMSLGASNNAQAKLYAQSAADKLEEYITGVNYDSFEAQWNAFSVGESPLWFYLRYNVEQNNWPYYKASENTHDKDHAYRYFIMSVGSKDVYNMLDYKAAIGNDTSVLMYWENKDNETILTVEVRCEKDSDTYVATNKYKLIKSAYSDGAGSDHSILPGVNPSGNSIANSEKWVWVAVN